MSQGKCVENQGFADHLTLGRVYGLAFWILDKEAVVVISDRGIKCLFPKHWFI